MSAPDPGHPDSLKPLSALPDEVVRNLRGVFCDIDDTLTWGGRMVPAAFEGLSEARRDGLKVVPITGRPGGWVDHLARMWPVDGVVGENGGLWFWTDDDGHMQRRFLQPEDERGANRARLDALATTILQRVPGAGIASDQPYRDLDLAIDFCEDVPRLGDDAIDAIVEAFEQAGATAKVSSIHVNGWFGDFDKLTGCRRFCADRWGIDLDDELDRWLYVGDSANDEPMFATFPHSVGVANVREFLPRMAAWPTYVTEGSGGGGFAELIERVLRRRRSALHATFAQGDPIAEASWPGPDGEDYPVRVWAPRVEADGMTWVCMLQVGLWHEAPRPVFGASALQAIAQTSEVLEAAWHSVPRYDDPVRAFLWHGTPIEHGSLTEGLVTGDHTVLGRPERSAPGWRCGLRIEDRLADTIVLPGDDAVEALMHACRLVRLVQTERWRDHSMLAMLASDEDAD